MPYGTRVRVLAEGHPDVVAVTFCAEDGTERSVTWAELDARSNQVARVLTRRGVGLGDRFGIMLRNSPEHYFCSFAAWKIGAVPVPMRWDLPAWELERVLAVLDAAYVLERADGSLEESLSESAAAPPEVTSPHTVGLLSSGSTGTPKIILRLAPAIFDPASPPHPLVANYGPISDPQRVLVPAPMYHSNGFMSNTQLLNGDRVVVLERFDARRILDVINAHRVSGFVATTVMLQRLERDPFVDECDFSQIEWLMHGAAPLPDWLAQRWIQLVGRNRFFVCYGSSEVIGTTFARGDEYLAHPGTVGRGANGTEIRIYGPEDVLLPAGEIGAIFTRMPSGILASYIGSAPIPVTDDGFGSVGDLGWLDGDGYLFLADRRDDLIITGGANVFPAEVEAALSDHPDVADVVVIGLPDPEWGRRVHAIVQPRDPEACVNKADLVTHAKTRLAPYKVPKSIEFIDQIPRSEAFKVNRGRLIEERTRPVAVNQPIV